MKLTTSRKKCCFALLFLTCVLAASAFAGWCPSADLNGNCWVNIYDLKILADQWLDAESCEEAENCADFDGLNGIDFADFAFLANQWQTHGNMLFINEFMASNNSASDINDPYGDYDDWIEIYNLGDTSVDMAGMYLTDDLTNPTQFHIPTGYSSQTTIPAGGFLVFWADDETTEGPLHTNFKLSGSGEEIGLFDTNGITPIDTIVFGEQTTNISYGCYPDAEENWRFFPVPTPAADNNGAYLDEIEKVEFSKERGFYDASFNLTLACTTSGANIYYTTDGQVPIAGEVNAPGSIRYTAPIAISSTKCVRAAAIKTGWKPSNIETHTYIFLSDVITQSPSGERPDPNWPVPHTNTNPYTDPIQCIDYGMDPDVINDSRYVNLVDDALLSIPTISLVTDLKNLFDLSTGIWVNAAQEGRLWERPCSIELIYPPNPQGPGFPDLVQVPDANGGYRWDLPSDMRGGFHIDAGMRIRGGWSSHSNNPKHAFRLFFRPEYGEAKLMYPLFGTDGDDEFDHMDLRTSQNYSWGYEGDQQNPIQRNTMVRDVFSRDTQRDMGQPYTRSRYYHLYINGQYWGIFQTQERSDASYAVSYFGGEKEDYDVVKVNGWPSADDYKIAATDGNLDAYRVLWQAATAGFSTDAAYYGVQGLKPDGTYDPNGRKLVDIDNLIDYMLCVYYTGDADGPISSPRNNTRPNNLWAIYNRNKPDGFKFFRHDCEHTLDTGQTDRTGPYDNWELQQFEYFTPQWLSQKLTGHPEYVMRFADRVHKQFFNGGVLTPQSAVAHWTARANEIDLAIIAESARWGDAKYHPPRTKDDDWLPAINNVTNNYFPSRTGVVLDQFRTKGWYPNINAPSFNQQGGYVTTSDTFTITDPCASGGTIYYTTDGNDPRTPFTGTISSSAIQYTGAFTLNKSTDLKARIYKSSTGKWSALNEAIFALPDVNQNLRITEIMYHPLDTNNPNDPNTEYIELKNVGSGTINLNLVKFDKGVDFTFGPNTLTAGQHILVVRNKAAFEAKYGTGRYIAGQYAGSLDNAGEKIRLLDAVGGTILDFDYKDGWRSIVDGDGYSLTIINPADSNVANWGKKDSWRASAYVNGSPGWDDSGIIPNPGEIAINEVLAHTDTEPNDWIELRNTTGASINIGGWFLSDSDNNLMKYRFATGTTIPAGGYLVLGQDTNFGPAATDPGRLIPFALSENGEMVCLTSALDVNSKLTGYREKEDFGASERDVSFGRYYKASTNSYNFVPMDHNTPGQVNAYPKIGPIIITEIMYHPDWPTTGIYANDEYEYIELRNTSAAAVTLYDSVENLPWKFTNGIDYTFPDTVTIAAGARILVVKNPTAFSARYSSVPTGIIYGPYTGWLANDGEQLELSKPGDVDGLGVRHYIRVERVDYSDGWHPGDEPGDVDLWPTGADGLGKSLKRTSDSAYGNDPNNWTATTTPTPGS